MLEQGGVNPPTIAGICIKVWDLFQPESLHLPLIPIEVDELYVDSV